MEPHVLSCNWTRDHGGGAVTGARSPPKQCVQQMEERTNALQWVRTTLSSSWSRPPQRVVLGPAVVFMRKRLEQSGCPVAPKHLSCQPCSYDRSGGFVPNAGITILCQGRFWSKSHMEHTLIHELVHMYDQCMFKVDWENLRHHACSEVGRVTMTLILLATDQRCHMTISRSELIA